MDGAAIQAALVVLAMALVVGAGAAARRRPVWTLLAAGGVTGALVADTVVASSLTFAYTI